MLPSCRKQRGAKPKVLPWARPLVPIICGLSLLMHILVNEKLVFFVQYLPLVLGKRSSKCQNPHLPMALIMEILLALVNACLALIDNENHLTRIGLFLGIVADLQPLLSNAKGVSISKFVAQDLSKRKFVAQELTIALHHNSKGERLL